jgi:hypothetical protein
MVGQRSLEGTLVRDGSHGRRTMATVRDNDHGQGSSLITGSSLNQGHQSWPVTAARDNGQGQGRRPWPGKWPKPQDSSHEEWWT